MFKSCYLWAISWATKVLLTVSYFMSDQSSVTCELFHGRPKSCYLWAISWATTPMLMKSPFSPTMDDDRPCLSQTLLMYAKPATKVGFSVLKQMCDFKLSVSQFEVIFKIIFLSYTWFKYICLFFLMKNLPSIFREFFTSVYLQLIHDIWL